MTDVKTVGPLFRFLRDTVAAAVPDTDVKKNVEALNAQSIYDVDSLKKCEYGDLAKILPLGILQPLKSFVQPSVFGEKEWVKNLVKDTIKETLESVGYATSESDAKSTGSKRSRGSDASHYSGKRRDTKKQSDMSAAVMTRDGKCLVTGSGPEHALDCAHIVGLENIESFPRDMHYDPSMGFALRKDLHPSYDRHEWYFKADGSVVTLRPNTVELPKSITVPPKLDKTAMGVKERLALTSAAGRCSYCWKRVGMVNMADHRKRSCSDPTLAKGPKPADWSSAVCDVEMASSNLE